MKKNIFLFVIFENLLVKELLLLKLLRTSRLFFYVLKSKIYINGILMFLK